jgi:hypothetical protein
MKQLLFYIFLGTLLSACAPVPVKVDDQQLSMIREGQTTGQEVVQRLGRPSSITETPQRRVLVYANGMSNNVEKQVVTSGAAIVGGVMAGPVGALAGGVLGRNVMPTNQTQDEITIEVDPVTDTVMSVQHQYTTNYQ